MGLFDTNRRGFLIGLTGALIAANTTLIIPAEALADPQIGRYAMAVKLHHDLIEASRNTKAVQDQFGHPNQNALSRESRDAFLEQADHLLDWLMDAFPVVYSDAALAQSNLLFRGELKVDTLSEDGLMSLMDSIVPLAIIKYDLAFEHMPFDTLRMRNFTRFASVYKDFIMGDVRA